MVVEPQREGVLDHAGDEGGDAARGQALLGLAGELRIEHLHRQHEGGALPQVIRAQLDATRQQAAVVAEFLECLEQTGAQAIDVGAAQRRGDQVDVGFLHQLAAFRQPLDRPVDPVLLVLEMADERRFRQALEAIGGAEQVIAQAILVMPGRLAAIGLDEHDLEARTQHGLGTQQVAQARHRQARAVEVALVRPEAHQSAGIALADGADLGQLLGLLAILEGDALTQAIAAHFHFQTRRQRIDHRDAHAVQAAGEAIAVLGELAPRVQLGEDQLDAGHAMLGVDVGGHATTVIADLDTAILEQAHADFLRVPRQRLIDGVVDDFLRQMVGPRSVGIHAGPLADRFEAGEDLNGTGAVLTHRSLVSLVLTSAIRLAISRARDGQRIPEK